MHSDTTIVLGSSDDDNSPPHSLSPEYHFSNAHHSDSDSENSVQVCDVIPNCVKSKSPNVHQPESANSSKNAIDLEVRMTSDEDTKAIHTNADDDGEAHFVPCESGMNNDISLTTTKSERKRRSKEEIERERAKKISDRLEKLKRKQQEKNEGAIQNEIAKFNRNLRSASNTQCEKNLFCVISEDLNDIENFQQSIKHIFNERNIVDNIIYEGVGRTIAWRRRNMEGNFEDGKFTRRDQLINESFHVLFVDGETFTRVATAGSFPQHVKNQIKMLNSPRESIRVTIIIYGKHKVEKKLVMEIVLDVYEESQVQIRLFETVNDTSLFIAQMHRSIAKLAKGSNDDKIIRAIKGTLDEKSLMTDWWSKMLAHIHRMGSDHRRAIVKQFPDPFDLMEQMNKIADPVGLIANVRLESGRCVGQALARKVYIMLSSLDGTEVVEDI